MKLYEITFSPTGGTQKAADLLTEALGGERIAVDLTDRTADFSAVAFTPEDVAVIAVPSYGGRVPAAAVQRLETMKGSSARAVLVCVYGNRAYEDTLVELEDAAKQAGFRIIAAVAAIAEHSIVRRYAAGRPDAEDAKQLQAFAGKIGPGMTRNRRFPAIVLIRKLAAPAWYRSLRKSAAAAAFARRSARWQPLMSRIPDIPIRTSAFPVCGVCPSVPSPPGKSVL